MRSLRTRTSVLAVVALASLMTAGCSSDDGGGSSTSPVKIGVILDLTGPAATIGGPQEQGIRTAVDLLNQNLGAGGRKVELEVQDSASDPARAVAKFRQMQSTFRPDAVIGSSVTATCDALANLTRAAKIVQFCLSAAPLPEQDDYYFSSYGPPQRIVADTPVRWMVERGYKKVGVVATTDASGQLYTAFIGTAVKGAGLTSVEAQTFAPGTSDVTPQLTRLRSAGADVVFLGTTGSAMVTILNGVKQLGWQVPLVAGAGSATLTVADLLKDVLPAQGLFVPGERIQVPSLAEQGSNATTVKEFVSAFTSKYPGTTVDTPNATGADAATMLVTAIRAGNSDAPAITSYLETHPYDGLVQKYDFSASHRSSDISGVVLRYTTDGFALDTQFPACSIPEYWAKGGDAPSQQPDAQC